MKNKLIYCLLNKVLAFSRNKQEIDLSNHDVAEESDHPSVQKFMGQKSVLPLEATANWESASVQNSELWDGFVVVDLKHSTLVD